MYNKKNLNCRNDPGVRGWHEIRCWNETAAALARFRIKLIEKHCVAQWGGASRES